MAEGKSTLERLNVLLDKKNKANKNKEALKIMQLKFGYNNANFRILDKEKIFSPYGYEKNNYLNKILGILKAQNADKEGKNSFSYGQMYGNISIEKYKPYFFTNQQLDDLLYDIYGEYGEISVKYSGFPFLRREDGRVNRMFFISGVFKEILKEANKLIRRDIESNGVTKKVLEKDIRDKLFTWLQPYLLDLKTTKDGELVGNGIINQIINKFVSDGEIKSLNIQREGVDIVKNKILTEVFYENIFLIDDFKIVSEDYIDENGKISKISVLAPRYGTRWFSSNLLNSIILTEGYTKMKKGNEPQTYINGPLKGKPITKSVMFNYIRNKVKSYGDVFYRNYGQEISLTDFDIGDNNQFVKNTRNKG